MSRLTYGVVVLRMIEIEKIKVMSKTLRGLLLREASEAARFTPTRAVGALFGIVK